MSEMPCVYNLTIAFMPDMVTAQRSKKYACAYIATITDVSENQTKQTT